MSQRRNEDDSGKLLHAVKGVINREQERKKNEERQSNRERWRGWWKETRRLTDNRELQGKLRKMIIEMYLVVNK